MSEQEKIRELGFELAEDSLHYRQKGAHRTDIFPWMISKQTLYEMDKRDWSALRDIVRIVR